MKNQNSTPTPPKKIILAFLTKQTKEMQILRRPHPRAWWGVPGKELGTSHSSQKELCPHLCFPQRKFPLSFHSEEPAPCSSPVTCGAGREMLPHRLSYVNETGWCSLVLVRGRSSLPVVLIPLLRQQRMMSVVPSRTMGFNDLTGSNLLVSRGCWNKLPQTRQLKTTEVYFFTSGGWNSGPCSLRRP